MASSSSRDDDDDDVASPPAVDVDADVPLSLLEAVWDVETAPPLEQPARLFIDLAPPKDAGQRRRRLAKLETSLEEIANRLQQCNPQQQQQQQQQHHQQQYQQQQQRHSPGFSKDSTVHNRRTLSSSSCLSSLSSFGGKDEAVFRFIVISLFRLATSSPFTDVAAFAQRQLPAFLATTPTHFRRRILETMTTTSAVISSSLPAVIEDSLASSSSASSSSDSAALVEAEEVSRSKSLPLLPPPISAFIPSSELPPLDSDDEFVASLFQRRFSGGGGGGGVDAYSSTPRLDHVCRLLATHPSYLEAFLRVEGELTSSSSSSRRSSLLENGGGGGNHPLSAAQARYLAIMSSASQNCPYSIFLESQKFLLNRGEPRWLRAGTLHHTDAADAILAADADAADVKILSKYRLMADFNQRLLHRPWALEALHVAALVRPAVATSSWSIPEVVHAIAVLAHFHGVACLVHGCGIAPEVDDLSSSRARVRKRRRRGVSGGGGGDKSNGEINGDDSSGGDEVEKVIDNMLCIDQLTGPEINADQKARVFDNIADEEPQIVVDAATAASSAPSSPTWKETPLRDRIATETSGSAEDEAERTSSPSQTASWGADLQHLVVRGPSVSSTKRFLGESKIRFIDFASSKKRTSTTTTPSVTVSVTAPSTTAAATTTTALATSPNARQTSPTPISMKRGSSKTSPKYEPMRFQDFSWQDHGYSIMSRFCEFSSLFDDKFEIAETLTYFTMGHRDEIDTTTFRIAVWNYVQLLYGIRHDDYDYRQLTIMLDLPLRKFIKAVACYPNRVTKELYDSCMKNFKSSEKIHVTIMIAEAKVQAELLYGLRALNDYLK